MKPSIGVFKSKHRVGIQKYRGDGGLFERGRASQAGDRGGGGARQKWLRRQLPCRLCFTSCRNGENWGGYHLNNRLNARPGSGECWKTCYSLAREREKGRKPSHQRPLRALSRTITLPAQEHLPDEIIRQYFDFVRPLGKELLPHGGIALSPPSITLSRKMPS